MLWSANIDSRFKPIISGNLIFLLTMKNYLICLNSEMEKYIGQEIIKILSF